MFEGRYSRNLQCSASNALKPSLFVRPPHTDIPYTIDGIITLKYKTRAFGSVVYWDFQAVSP